MAAVFSTFAAAQSPSTADHTLSTSSTLVVVPALVRDAAGAPVFNLSAGDFRLTDDGVPQKLNLEQESGPQPLALVALIEAGAGARSSGWHPANPGAPPDRFATLPTMIEALAGNVPHRISVVGFDSGPELLQDFTGDMAAVTETIQDLSKNIDGDGGAAILDSIGFALDLLRKQPPQYRRAILLLSETNDRGSKMKLEDALRAIGETNTMVYSLAFSTGNTRASEYAHRQLPTKLVPCPTEPQLPPNRDVLAPPPPPCTPPGIKGLILDILTLQIGLENPTPGPAHGCMSTSDPAVAVAKNPLVRAYDCLGQLLPPLTLAKVGAIAATQDLQRNVPQTVARLTGGEYFKFNDAKSLEQHLQALSNHIPNRYLLSFQPQTPHSGFHLITLQLPEYQSLKVSARNGYWIDAPAAPAK